MNKKIFFVGNLGKGSTFIDNDYNQLKKYFDVRYTQMKLYFHLNILETLKNVIWCDEIYGWFASWRMIIPTIFAKIFHKKIVVVAGGYDVVNEPSIKYGAFTKLPDKEISKFVFKHADIVLPVSRHTQKELLEKVSVKETKIVYNGVDANKWYPQGVKDDNFVLTVAEIKWGNLKRKGIENFVIAAKYLPDVTFAVIGAHSDNSIDYLKSIATDNVKFLGRIPNEKLLQWYQKTKVYAQLSFHEGFGVAVAEAMLCECIPVLSTKGALPEVGGKNAYYVPFGDPKFAATVIERALKSNNGGIFRARVMLNFQLKKRISELRRIL